MTKATSRATTDTTYNQSYWVDGVDSCYKDYRYMPEKALPRAKAFTKAAGVEPGGKILDFACGMASVVAALVSLGYDAIGVDTSPWPVENCVPEAKGHVGLLGEQGLQKYKGNHFDLVIAKDIFEHIP